ncbi:phosphatase PAP2 family protein [Hylemonella sp. W303a]|uniref:phosphatase PAP2 family protein n=1 Tax=Hylemonella sp. W303a TaxID=3389873 RepID=UPI00396B010F
MPLSSFCPFLTRSLVLFAGRLRRSVVPALTLVLFASLTPKAQADGCKGDGSNGGILGMDRCDEYEAGGIFSRRNQLLIDSLVIGGTVSYALWEGNTSPNGRVAWQAMDSMVTTAIVTEAMKRTFQRARPSEADNPNQWRQGSNHRSFPSGETALMAAFVTPLIIAGQARADTDPDGGVSPAWGLVALPIYMARGRVAAHGHWLSDVVAGGTIGAGMGYLSTQRQTPLLLLPTSDGIFVGVHYRF